MSFPAILNPTAASASSGVSATTLTVILPSVLDSARFWNGAPSIGCGWNLTPAPSQSTATTPRRIASTSPLLTARVQRFFWVRLVPGGVIWAKYTLSGPLTAWHGAGFQDDGVARDAAISNRDYPSATKVRGQRWYPCSYAIVRISPAAVASSDTSGDGSVACAVRAACSKRVIDETSLSASIGEAIR